MDANKKRYLRELGASMAAYTAVVWLSVWLLKSHPRSTLRYGIAALPLIPSAFAVWSAIRFFRGLDELQRRIQFEAMAFSFLGTCLISLNLGILQKAGLPHADVTSVTLLLFALYCVGIFVAWRRYA
ncbi:MAG TPA: hypothetical protein VMD76_02665 [Candidatus Sulfotelmatobacter sp.]|nr:hypothetical protein [Candidatus Sulfotelmatobacter sp.]